MEEKDKEGKKLWTPSSMLSTVFLLGVAGVSSMAGFGRVLGQARKASPSDFDKGVFPDGNNMESGSKLAMRALRRATLYSVGGFSIFCFGVMKAMGVSNLDEFTKKIQGVFPKIPKAKTADDTSWEDVIGLEKKKDDSQ